MLTPAPTTTPTLTSSNTRDSTGRTTPRGVAPSAILIPISVRRRATASAVTPYNSSAASPQGDPGEEPGEHGDDGFLLERIVHLDVEHLKPHSERRLDCGESGVDLWRHRGLSSQQRSVPGQRGLPLSGAASSGA